MQHVMLDLETLGTRPGCKVMSVGAVFFNPVNGELGEQFYGVALRAQQGLHEEPATLAWWEKQSEDARAIFTAPDAVPLDQLLYRFCTWLSGTPDVRVWGNGADFDNAILTVALHTCGHDLPWKFWNSRCYRTIKNLNVRAPLKRLGVYHNSLDDAISQAEHLMAIVEDSSLVLE